MSGDFTCSSSGEEVENGSVNQWPRQPSWISHCF